MGTLTSRRLWFGLVIAVFTTAAVMAAGDKQKSTDSRKKDVHEEVSVSLVEVPVNVFDHAGEPVRGLTAADFSLEDDGRRQTIDSVDGFDLNHLSNASTTPANLPSTAVRRFLLLFDLTFAQPKNVERARASAFRFLEKSLIPDDLVAVATISNERGIELLANFSRDRLQAKAAIETLGLEVPSGRANDPLAFAFVTPGDPFIAAMLPPDFNRPGQSGELASYSKVVENFAKTTIEQHDVTQVDRQLIQIRQLAQALDLVSGRKEILFFTEGFDPRLLIGDMGRPSEENLGNNDAMVHGNFWQTPVDDRYLNVPLQHKMDDTLAVFRRADCVVYPIKIAMLQAAGDASSTGRASGSSSDAALFPFAEATGGEVIGNSNDLDAQMRRILRRTSFVYVLTYRPSKIYGDGRFHTLKLAVNRRHLSVSGRAGYFETRAFPQLNPLERVLSTSEIINRADAGGKLPIEVTALPLATRDLGEVSVFVHVLPAVFASSNERRSLGVFVYLRDPAGGLVDYSTRGISVDPKQATKALDQEGITYFSTCHARAGAYQLNVVVRDEQSGDYGFQRVAVDVPASDEANLRVLPPVFLRNAETGVNIRDRSQGMKSDDLLHLGDVYYVPSAGNRLRSSEPARMCLLVYGKPGSPAGDVRIDALITTPGGTAEKPARVSLVGRTSSDSEGLVRLLLDLDPGNLPPGDHALRVRVRSKEGDLVSSWSSTTFHIS